MITPNITLDIFYYSCDNKFVTDPVKKYIKTYDGSIVFANGQECIIYEYTTEFIKKKHINGNLVKRHKKGGQSSVRFARLAEESRTQYVSRIIDDINKIKTKNNWIFGSSEILSYIFDKTHLINVKINNGGFYDFDLHSINNVQRWVSYFDLNTTSKTNDHIFKKMVYYLDVNPDMLDFSKENKNEMMYFIDFNNTDELDDPKNLIIDKKSEWYNRLCIFEYIGLKYYNIV